MFINSLILITEQHFNSGGLLLEPGPLCYLINCIIGIQSYEAYMLFTVCFFR